MSNGKTEQSANLLREYVYRALSNKAKGTDATSYANLVKELGALKKKAERDPSDATLHLLANMIHALKDCVSSLRERKHDALLNEALGIKLWSCPAIVRAAVLELVGNLAVVNAAFTHTCLQLLVYNFLPPPAPPAPDVDQGQWKISEEAVMVQSVVLATVGKVMQMVPTAPTKLLQLIVQHMPHKLRDRGSQCLYLTAVFGLAESPAGAPIRDGLLAAAVEHLLSIDVEIRWEDIVDVATGEVQEEGDSEDEEQEDIFELEGMSELDINATPEERRSRRLAAEAAGAGAGAADRGGWEGAAATCSPGAAASTSGRPAVDETANKLDSLMELTFEHLARRQQPGHLADLWASLLSIFERTILNTNRSKFTQFLLFYACKQQPQPCATAFVDLLLTRLHDARQPAITRSACASYIASFLARAAFAPHSLVLHALQRLCGFCRQYGESSLSSTPVAVPGLHRAQSGGGLDALAADSTTAQHQVFYASIQSALYILCYHLRTLMAGSCQEGASKHAAATRQLVQEQLLPLLNHRLAPMAVCLPSVVLEFKHQAAALGLISQSAASVALVAQGQRAQRPLEMFFPFDPYLLKRSSRHLQLRQSYIRWRHGHASMHSSVGAAAVVEGGSDVEHEDDSDDSDEEEDEEQAMDDASDDDDSSGDELEGMSLPNDAVLARPGVALGRRPPKAPHGALLASATMLHGGARGAKHAYLQEDMAMSYSPGHTMSSVGDQTPTGMSPTGGLVNYLSPCGASPMQMTPVFSHMEAIHSRLGAHH